MTFVLVEWSLNGLSCLAILFVRIFLKIFSTANLLEGRGGQPSGSFQDEKSLRTRAHLQRVYRETKKRAFRKFTIESI
jgi:hypothetical protein